jgi:hypothetical protein
MNTQFFRAWLLGPVLDSLTTLQRTITMNSEELSKRLTEVDASLTDIGTGVDKVGLDTDSLLMEVRALQEQIAAGGVTNPAIDAALAALQTRARGLADSVAALDAKVPDSVAAIKTAAPDAAPAVADKKTTR